MMDIVDHAYNHGPDCLCQDDRYEFKYVEADGRSKVGHTITLVFPSGVSFPVLLQKFRAFALASGYLRETVDKYIPEDTALPLADRLDEAHED